MRRNILMLVAHTGVDLFSLVSTLQGMVGSVVALIGATFQTFLAPSGLEWLYLILVGAFAFFGQILFNKGVQLERAGPASVIRTLDVVFSFIWQMAVEHIMPNPWSVLGAIVILLCVFAVGVRNFKNTKKEPEKKEEKHRETNGALQANTAPTVSPTVPQTVLEVPASPRDLKLTPLVGESDDAVSVDCRDALTSNLEMPESRARAESVAAT
jgi:hypothetical protein